MKTNILSVGIPLYNAHSTLKDALSSIRSQTIKPFEVVMIDDGSEKDYEDIIREFTDLNIRMIYNAQNQGVGYIRNQLVEVCVTPYLTMIDSDDVFLMATSIQDMVDNIQGCDMLMTTFLEQHQNFTCSSMPMGTAWCHGKVYNVNTLRSNNLKFLDARTHEELVLNVSIFLNPKFKVIANDSLITYLWRFNKSSLTRKEDYLRYNLPDYIDGVTKAYLYLKNEGLEYNSTHFAIESFINMHYYYEELRNKYGEDDIINNYKKLLIQYGNTSNMLEAFNDIFNTGIFNYGGINNLQFNSIYSNCLANLNELRPRNVLCETIFDFLRRENYELGRG